MILRMTVSTQLFALFVNTHFNHGQRSVTAHGVCVQYFFWFGSHTTAFRLKLCLCAFAYLRMWFLTDLLATAPWDLQGHDAAELPLGAIRVAKLVRLIVTVTRVR